jgi:hypothetical protein
MTENERGFRELAWLGDELDSVNPVENPEKSKALLRRRKELRRKTEEARDRSIAYQKRKEARS